MLRKLVILIALLSTLHTRSQSSEDIRPISIGGNDDFSGFESIEIANERLFVLGEQSHTIAKGPQTTMKLLRHLHSNANVRVLAIEHGTSTAVMINDYLSSGDTTDLRHIARNTMMWSKENWAFLQDLRIFNLSLPATERVNVRSIDIEYKMESAIYYMVQLIGDKTIPEELEATIGVFSEMYNQSKDDREKYQGIAINHYYDKELVQQLVGFTLEDLIAQERIYKEFFGSDYSGFTMLVQDMYDGLIFDFTNPNTNYKFRDRLIYQKFIRLLDEFPDVGILCTIGARHASKPSSIHQLRTYDVSPIKDRVMTIRLSALYNGFFLSSDFRKINFNYPNILKSQEASLIRHNPENRFLKSKDRFDYTLFINDSGILTPFDKVLREDY